MAGCGLLMLLLAGMFGCATQAVKPFEQGAERYKFDIDLTPVFDRDKTISCIATVTDIASGHAISIPRFTARWGETKQVDSEDQATGARLDLTLIVDESGNSAMYDASVKKVDQLIASHRTTVSISR